MIKTTKHISQKQITGRWVWSRLCGFPHVCTPGTTESRDYRQLYKRAKVYFNISVYSVRRAAQRLGVFTRRDEYSSDAIWYQKPYVKGWRVDAMSWASVRDPTWTGARNRGVGIYDWSKGAMPGASREERKTFQFQVEKNINERFPEESERATLNEFHYPRPEIFELGFTNASNEYDVRRRLIETFIPDVDFNELKRDGRITISVDDYENLCSLINSQREDEGKSALSRQYFRRLCNRFGFSFRGDFVYVDGFRAFLDVVDQIKYYILKLLKGNLLQNEFDLKSLYKRIEGGKDDVKLKMLYDAALAELVYEGFLKTRLVEVNLGPANSADVDFYGAAVDFQNVDVELAYLHTLNSTRMEFPRVITPRYAEYIGLEDLV